MSFRINAAHFQLIQLVQHSVLKLFTILPYSLLSNLSENVFI